MQIWAVPVTPLLVLLPHPVVLAILDLPRGLQSLSKETTKIVIVRFVFEAEAADVAEILLKLLGEIRAKVLDRRRLFLLANLLVLLLVGGSLETLPR